MIRCRTTIQPDVELEVSEEEYLDLQRQGLIASDDTSDDSSDDAPGDAPDLRSDAPQDTDGDNAADTESAPATTSRQDKAPRATPGKD